MDANSPPLSRWRRLQAETDTVHRALDARIMAADPFRTVDRYGRFLRMQLRFFRDIDPLYAEPALAVLIADVAERRRLPLAEQDANDLNLDLKLDLPAAGEPPLFAGAIDVPTALGWLYVAEGADLGSPFLLKETARIGFDESFGARHMRGHPEGRGKHWHRFTDALDAAALTQKEESRVTGGAFAAFARVAALFEAAGF
jgi:heme oxygenase